jgi:putative Holliday junction resolvase
MATSSLAPAPTPRDAGVPPEGALLALDVGDRRVGIAACDPGRLLVTPLPPLRRSAGEGELAELRRLVAEYVPAGLVVGLPLLPEGGEGGQARKTRRYAARLRAALGLPVAYVDERHSSALAGRALIESGRSGRRNRSRYLDSLAAAVILEDYLAAGRAGDR